MSEERLSYLSLISIEQQETRKIELDELITDFAKKNVRRQSLFRDLLLECRASCMLASSVCREQPNELVTFVVQPDWYCERILFCVHAFLLVTVVLSLTFRQFMLEFYRT
ncbi:hypothetical protein TNCV_4867371 [Trichonephila clavipes]|nr:hypothetical protein TNCV_4867371 [Trichonephila clavipes]